MHNLSPEKDLASLIINLKAHSRKVKNKEKKNRIRTNTEKGEGNYSRNQNKLENVGLGPLATNKKRQENNEGVTLLIVLEKEESRQKHFCFLPGLNSENLITWIFI